MTVALFMTQVIGSAARLTLRRDLRTLVAPAMTESRSPSRRSLNGGRGSESGTPTGGREAPSNGFEARAPHREQVLFRLQQCRASRRLPSLASPRRHAPHAPPQ